MLFGKALRSVFSLGPSMKLLTIFFVINTLLLSTSIHASTLLPEPDLDELTAREEDSLDVPLNYVCRRFNDLNNFIRDGKISKFLAQTEFLQRLSAIRTEYYRRTDRSTSTGEWVFPLAGYDERAIGNGIHHGFISRGYDFFDGNRHSGHPACDIFIRDRNQDGNDDQTGKRVTVLSMTGGIVVAVANGWEEGSKLRGGRYIWIYDPDNELLVYYAHNEEVFTKLGNIVKPGDPLASVGRSGYNAAKKRSPTHLHLTVLKVNGKTAKAIDIYQKLKMSKKYAAP
jgi:murein DD-endopeptidase MepM/ murein hydrolase activator NlpD